MQKQAYVQNLVVVRLYVASEFQLCPQKFTSFALLQGAAKSSTLKFFAVFSATVWNFDLKFDSFIY